MLRQLFTQTNRGFKILAPLQVRLEIGKLQFTLTHQIADTVQRDAAIVTDDTTTTVTIRQAGQHPGFTAAQHIRRVGVEYALVMGFTQFSKLVFKISIHLTTISIKRAFDHVDATKRMQSALERLIRLQTNDFFQFLFNITRIMRGYRGSNIGIEINRRVRRVFNTDARHNFFPQCSGRRRCFGEERFIPFIRRIVVLNKITDINFFFPVRTFKAIPGFGIQHIAGIDIYLHEK